MSENSFRPFETDLDEGSALAILRDATAGADDGELFLESTRSEVLAFDDGRLRNASYDSTQGFGLRTVLGGTAGYAHASELSEAALRRASETARMAARDGGGVMAAAPARTNHGLYPVLDPVSEEPVAAKIELLKEIDDYLRSKDARVVQVSASLTANVQEVEILRPEGGRVVDVRPLTRMNVSVIVEKDGRRESGSAGSGGRHGYDILIAPDAWRTQADEALRVALINLEAEDAPAGVMEV
ncbi:MAG: DNA gyrase modulator, partial [Pseudomonadota bacterium]